MTDSKPRLVFAKSELPFPNLNGPSCPWHESCTPMDCEFFGRTPSAEQSQRHMDAAYERGRHSKC